MRISFESEVHNIYDPVFTSDNKSNERSASSLERSVFEDFEPINIQNSDDEVLSSGSS